MFEQLMPYYILAMDFINSNIYIKALAIFLAFFLCSKLAYWILVNIVILFVKKTETTVDDEILEAIKRPITLIIALLGVYFAVQVFTLGNTTAQIIDRIIYSVILVIVTYIVIRVIDILINAWGKKWASKTDTNLDDALLPMFHKFTIAVLGIIGFLYILTVWGIAIGPVLASLGIAGLALGLALQDTLKNIFGGISLILDKAYGIGDIVEFEGNVTGTIYEVGLRSTRVLTFDGQLVAIPNGAIANQRVINRGHPTKDIRVDVDFSVAYGTRYQDVKRYIVPVIKENFKSQLLKDKDIDVIFLKMGESALLFSCRFWVKDVADRFACQVKATELIYDELNTRKISIPFPQMDVHIRKK